MCISPAARNDIFKGSTTRYDESIKCNNVLVGPEWSGYSVIVVLKKWSG